MCHGKRRLPRACRSCIASGGPWKLPSNTSRRLFTWQSTHWALRKRRCVGLGCFLVASNVLAVVLAARRGVHGQEKIDQEVSLYSVANAIATTSTGMMIATPEPAWGVFATMSTLELAGKILGDLADYVRLEAFRKSPTRARKTRSNPKRSSKKGHVSTAKLLKSRKAKVTAP